MKYPKLLILTLMSVTLSCTQKPADGPPVASISNEHVDMKLYLPDSENGFYRATRFDWSGIIYSLEYAGHQYVGEWKDTQDPLFHEDLTGPAEGYIDPGLGFDEADIGGEFIRIGVGALKKTEAEYDWMKTYEIIDHGKWEVDQGKDWIQFQHTLQRETGYGYIYTKRIELMEDEPGFAIIHTLKNTGTKVIQTDQFNHNFFVMDGEMTGPDFQVEFPFQISTEDDLRDLVQLEENRILFKKDFSRESIFLALDGYENTIEDHQMQIVNRKTGAGVKLSVDKPLHKMVFWATTTTLCPENFIYLDVPPGEGETWISEYRLFNISDQWISLFDGETLEGWKRFNAEEIGPLWSVEEGAIKCDGVGHGEGSGEFGGSLITQESFGNFELELEWRISEGGNSGILYHVVEKPEYSHAYVTGPEYQVMDDPPATEDHANDNKRAGSSYDMYAAPLTKTLHPPMEWNSTRIIYNKGKVEHWLNGEKVVEFDEADGDFRERYEKSKWSSGEYPHWNAFKEGSIALQDHGAVVWYRNIRIRKL